MVDVAAERPPLLRLDAVEVPGRLRVDLRLQPGLVVVVGRNGAGKSTLLDVVSGLLAPARGAVWLEGSKIQELTNRERARRVAALGHSEEGADGGGLLACERIAQGLAPRRGPGALWDEDTAARVAAVGAELGLTPAQLDAPLGRLSFGQRRRVHLARALIDDAARVLVLDEPFAGLDLEAARLLTGALRRRVAARLVLVSVHELERALVLGGRLLGLVAGAVVVDGALPGALSSEAASAIWGEDVRVVQGDGGYVGVLVRP
jgi:iron complex transport system ATP-binding protein